jgi:hypothetical protein
MPHLVLALFEQGNLEVNILPIFTNNDQGISVDRGVTCTES